MRLRKIVREVCATGSPWIIRKDGKPVAMVVDYAEYQAHLDAFVDAEVDRIASKIERQAQIRSDMTPSWEEKTAGKA